MADSDTGIVSRLNTMRGACRTMARVETEFPKYREPYSRREGAKAWDAAFGAFEAQRIRLGDAWIALDPAVHRDVGGGWIGKVETAATELSAAQSARRPSTDALPSAEVKNELLEKTIDFLLAEAERIRKAIERHESATA